MLRKKTLSIGSISEATLVTNHLVSAFLEAADGLTLSRDERRTVTDIENSEYHDEEDIAVLIDILNNHAPAFCYVGSHEGDGASFGCWVNWESIRDAERDGTLYSTKWSDKELVAKQSPWDYWLNVNDHGNTTLYRKSGNRWTTVWDLV